MKTPIFAANWKMNLGPSDATAFMRTFLERTSAPEDRTLIFFPPALSLESARDAAGRRDDLQFGVQNIHWAEKGAFTGEISAPMARDAGASFVLVGHSERRHVFGETLDETGLKCEAAMKAGLIPVLCVGETLEERERGHTSNVVLRQLHAGIARLQPASVTGMVVAYEPVWAIGTGRNATPEDATATHRVLRWALSEIAPEGGAGVPILYGGSVNQGNAASLLGASEVDGILVGGASLDAVGWATIVGT